MKRIFIRGHKERKKNIKNSVTVQILNSFKIHVPLVSEFSTQDSLSTIVCAILRRELFLPFQKLEIALLRQQRENGVIFHSSTTESNMRNAQQRITIGHGVLR